MVEEVIGSASAERGPIHQEREEAERGHMIQDRHIAQGAEMAENVQVEEGGHTLQETDTQIEVKSPVKTAGDQRTAEGQRKVEDQKRAKEREREEVLLKTQEKTREHIVETLDTVKDVTTKAQLLKTLEANIKAIVKKDQFISTQTEATLIQDPLHRMRKSQ